NGLEKLQAGVPVDVQWRSAGLAVLQPVLLSNVSDSGGVEDWQANVYQTAGAPGQGGSSSTIAEPIDLSGLADAAPEGIYRTSVWNSGNPGSELAGGLAVGGGHFTARLPFGEP